MICHLSIRHPICGLRRSNSFWHSWTEILRLMAAAHRANRRQRRIGCVSYLTGMGKANPIRYPCPAFDEHPHQNNHAPLHAHLTAPAPPTLTNRERSCEYTQVEQKPAQRAALSLAELIEQLTLHQRVARSQGI